MATGHSQQQISVSRAPSLRQGRFTRLRAASRGLQTSEENSVIAQLVRQLATAIELEVNSLGSDHDRDNGSQSSQQDEIRKFLESVTQELQTNASSKDVFRRAAGFETLLVLFESNNFDGLALRSVLDSSASAAPREIGQVRNALRSLQAALSDHPGNRKYFSLRLNGWQSLRNGLRALIHPVQADITKEDVPNPKDGPAILIEGLLALALSADSFDIAALSTMVGVDWTHLAQPQALAIAFRIALDGQAHTADTALQSLAQALTLARAIIHLSRGDSRACIALWQTSILSDALSVIWEDSTSEDLRTALRELIHSLGRFGLPNVGDAALIFRKATLSDDARNSLAVLLRDSKQPAYFSFDLRAHGFSSIEFPSLPRAFPSDTGYSLSTWIRINQFDPECHTTLFGAYDSAQKCFVLIYLEKDSHQLILQTSVRQAAIPSVRFKTARFVAGAWYHLSLVHRRNASSPDQSMAALFVNGDFIEQRKCTYPETPDIQTDRPRGYYPSGGTQPRAKPVQAFFGTPSGIAARPGPGPPTASCWDLAMAHLHQVPLPDEFIAVLHRLGPRYRGNFQDCLGPLLTYRASADLHRFNSLLHPDRAEKSDILTATEQRGSAVVAEARLLLAIDPSVILDFENQSPSAPHLSLVDLIEPSLDQKSRAKYKQLVQRGNSVAINTAIPTISDAVGRSHGVGVLTGDVLVVQPKPLDDLSWCLAGGISPLFQQVEVAQSRTALLQAVSIVFECVKDHWRISEAMEKGHGYGVLAIILREKLGLDALVATAHASTASSSYSRRPVMPLPLTEEGHVLARELLALILEFVGYDAARPERSVLINPMAYRVLLLDFDTWHRVDESAQELYWKQFSHFVAADNHRHHHFNAKRLSRMRAAKKIIESLKAEDVSAAAVERLLPALRHLLEAAAAAGQPLYRDVAMFITWALQDERAMPLAGNIGNGHTRALSQVVSIRQRANLWARGARSPRPTTPSGLSAASTPPAVATQPALTRYELAVSCLRLIVDMLCGDSAGVTIRRFAKTVPNRWLLHLLAEPDVRVIELALKIVCRSLHALGPEFKDPFAGKNMGFITLKSRLKPFWRSKTLWLTAFAVLFGKQMIPSNLVETEFSAFHLVEVLAIDDTTLIVHAEMLSPIFAMLEAGLRNVARTEDPDPSDAGLLTGVIQFLDEVYRRSSAFREFAISSRYTQELLFVLYPLLTGSDRLSAETELAADKEHLSFKGEEVKMRPHSNSIGERPPSVRSLNAHTGNRTPSPMAANRVEAPRRLSSFILINASNNESSRGVTPPAQFLTPMAPHSAEPVRINITNSLVESLLELAIGIFIDHICTRDKFAGVGLFQKVPPGFREHQAYFESYVLVNALAQLGNHLRLNQRLLSETKVLTNLARYTQHMAEAVSEGWFIDGAQPLLDFAGEILEHLQLPHIAQLKSVRLCSQSVNAVRVVFLKATLWRLSELNEDSAEHDVNDFLVKMTYWQTILFSPENQETLFTKLICFLLYHKLVSQISPVRLAAARLWRTVLVQKPTEAATLLTNAMGPEQRHLSTGFMRLVSMDDDDFLRWVDSNRTALDTVFHNYLSRPWDDFVQGENRTSEETSRNRLSKRREKLRLWASEETSTDDFISRFETSTNYWRANVHSQERTRLQRAIQDHQESLNQLLNAFSKLDKQNQHPAGLNPTTVKPRWQLDETEAASRMRMRILPDYDERKEIIQPKRKASERKPQTRLAINTQTPKILADDVLTPMSAAPGTPASTHETMSEQDPGMRPRSDSVSNSQLLEGGFEMVDDPKEDEDGLIEDKNRKIMTSLQRGDIVKQLYNVSRIVGLEACEGLLIVGEKCLYIQDNFFQRSDGEIVGVSQAPEDERDPYVHQISGKDVGSVRTKHSLGEQEIRHWTWAEVLSVSKRRFLLRDVSVEVFFTDGRSYLLTCMATTTRDQLYNSIITRAPHVHSASNITGEDAWRLDTLRTSESETQSLGSKFGNFFNSAPTHTATKKWMRGEMSNFQYLMLVNTMAGRTFNDLTQYPVFPWVLSDYTSEELDLTNPLVFRDFSKPMGCQSPAREAEYKDRFKQFAEMGDHNAPPFHYGTHYSSAMIVSSYLIRLQPFVQSYLLLQGGSFDHADRLFDSIEKAWVSASRENRSDVRELTPEFFYLPEFLTNMNAYDFGSKQGTGGAVNHVQLPKWAKGDPHIFVAKHREALESPYVSQNLHQWIDLVFGFKQRGEAAIEATNCFHHLSYGGAKDLDKIDDPVERLATIGIIHSFGQTPHQVFQKSHPAKEHDKQPEPKLDTLVETLIRLPDVMLQTGEQVADFTFSQSEKSLLACNPCRRNVPPHFDRFLQWGFADNSLRFYAFSTGRMLGMYENTHIGPITTATFVDSRTLLTAGVDATIGVWTLSTPSRNAVEISPKTYLFGHRTSVTILAASRVFSTLLSVSIDGQALLWGLNRYNCIRVLLPSGAASIQLARISNVTGHIALAAGSDVLLYTLNGHQLLRQRVSDRAEESVTALAFYEGSGTEYVKRELIFTGHPHGITNVWQLENLGDGEWKLVLVKRMSHAQDLSGAVIGAGNLASGKAAITCILPTARAVYTGDEEGNVWDWECVQRGNQ